MMPGMSCLMDLQNWCLVQVCKFSQDEATSEVGSCERLGRLAGATDPHRILCESTPGYWTCRTRSGYFLKDHRANKRLRSGLQHGAHTCTACRTTS
jgi:hypothetical protein